MFYREKLPDAPLSHVIECFWSLEVRESTENHILPDGSVDLIYSPEMRCRVIGAMTTEQVESLPAGTKIAGVRFRPGMAGTPLGRPIADFTDGFLPVEDLWPRRGRELRERLDDAASTREMFTVLENSIKPVAQEPTRFGRVLTALAASKGRISLDYLAREANLSPRHFRRRCLEESGLGPKQLARVLRFRHARELALSANKPNWSKIAAEAGYCDQAHLIREFVVFTKRTPSMAVLSNTR